MKPDYPSWLPVPSPNMYPGRKGGRVQGVVIHYTAGGSGKGTADYFAKREVSFKDKTGALKTQKVSASAHLVIDRDGTIYQSVLFADRAWHAGPATLWQGKPLPKGVNVNDFTIGIEIANWGELKVNPATGVTTNYLGNPVKGVKAVPIGGRYYEEYPAAQVAAVIKAMKVIVNLFPHLKREDVLGHSMIQMNKSDPGPAWDWDHFLDEVFGDDDLTGQCLDAADDDDRAGEG